MLSSRTNARTMFKPAGGGPIVYKQYKLESMGFVLFVKRHLSWVGWGGVGELWKGRWLCSNCSLQNSQKYQLKNEKRKKESWWDCEITID